MKKVNSINKDSVFLHFTGMMFGIGCNAFSKTAIEKINALKKRDNEKSYIVLLGDISWIDRYNLSMDSDEKRIFRQFSPGNLTMIVKDTKGTFSHISKDGKIGIRIPEDTYLRDFILEIDEPIISTSINISGEKSQNNLRKIRSKFSQWYDYEVLPEKIVKKKFAPSTIIEFTKEEIKCIREGSIPMKQIENAYLHPLITFVCTANICRSPMAEYYFKKLILKYTFTNF